MIGTVFSALVGGFGVFLLVAAAFVVAGATAARLVARRRIARPPAPPPASRPASSCCRCGSSTSLLGAVGVLLGWVIGTPLSPVFEAGLQDVLPGDGAAWTLRVTAGGLRPGDRTPDRSVLVPAWRATRQPPTTVLRDARQRPRRWPAHRQPGPTGRGLAVDRLSGCAGPSPAPGRAALAGGALVVATAGAVVSLGFIGTLDDVQADPAVTGNPWDVAVDAPADDAAAVEAVLDATPGVRRGSPSGSRPARGRRGLHGPAHGRRAGRRRLRRPGGPADLRPTTRRSSATASWTTPASTSATR